MRKQSAVSFTGYGFFRRCYHFPCHTRRSPQFTKNSLETVSDSDRNSSFIGCRFSSARRNSRYRRQYSDFRRLRNPVFRLPKKLGIRFGNNFLHREFTQRQRCFLPLQENTKQRRAEKNEKLFRSHSGFFYGYSDRSPVGSSRKRKRSFCLSADHDRCFFSDVHQ